VLWVKSFGQDDEDQSFSQGHMITGIAQCFGLVSAALIGFIFEKQKPSNHLIISNALVIIGYVWFCFITDPHSWMAIMAISVASLGIYGLMTLGFIIVNLHCGHKSRGAVMGINCLAGAVAILIVAKLGGLAFDHISRNSPFVMAAAFSGILLILNCIPIIRSKVDDRISPYH
jgi:predicted MFS family arabinose efflux permease